MEKEMQNLNWKCLPKEVRKEIRAEYQNAIEGSDLESFLQDFFGDHNLTSDTEPEEMLVVEMKKVQEMAQNDIARAMLLTIFGDKCLPDTPNTPDSGELKTQVAEGEPKFNEGQLVIYEGRVYVIEGKTGKHHYSLRGTCYEVHEDYLEPYTEENKETLEEKEMNRKALYNALCELESASVKVRKALISM
ncbi:MAG: hypothetical protein K2K45_07595 [Muribaculaceae bacterium]|nr:hypothetical protein [Muribaculaceae bacterium]